MVREAAIKLGFLRQCQGRCSVPTDNSIPNGFNQFDLFVDVKFACLLQEL